MTEHPILFSGEMVRAILAGRKTQTRRLPGLERANAAPDKWRLWHGELNGYWAFTDRPTQGEKGACFETRCPYGVPGDRLWVRETWGLASWYEPAGDEIHRFEAIRRRASDPDDSVTRWYPSIHMKRWMSRLTLEITNIRVERLHQISEEDAIAEGCRYEYPVTARTAFLSIWDSLNAKRGYGWGANPFVWVIEFKRVQP